MATESADDHAMDICEVVPPKKLKWDEDTIAEHDKERGTRYREPSTVLCRTVK
jgi:hypothetical protein